MLHVCAVGGCCATCHDDISIIMTDNEELSSLCRLGELIEVLKEMEREDKRSCDSGSGDKESESGGLEGMANKSQPR